MISILEKMKSYQTLVDKVTQINDFFSPLQFEEERHLYTVDGIQLTSVSGKIKEYTEPFDREGIAQRVASKRGVEIDIVLSEWDEIKDKACAIGNKTHLFGENYSVSSLPTNGYELAVVRFWASLPEHIIPVIFELKMYCKNWGVAGTADIILYNKKTNKFIIGDYKTNKDLFKNYKGKTLLGPFNNMLDMPISKYEMQLSYYQLLFEKTGFEIEDRFLVWVKPNGEFDIFHTDDLTDKIKKELDYGTW